MAATYTDNGGSVNGSNKVFTYNFPVLQTEDIQVALNGVTQAQNRYTPSLTPANITFHNSNDVDSTVQEADGAPKSGVTVRVYRKTTVGKTDGNEDPKAVFAAGSSIRAGDLNANIEQALFGIHEQQTNLILAEDINTGAITTAKIKADNITNALIADDQIDSEHYVAGSIDLEHMSANSVDSDQYVDGSVDLIHLSANSVDSSKIVDGSIVNADVNASAAIAGTKVSPAFGSQNISTSGTLAAGATTVTGNIAVSGTVDGRDIATDGSKLDNIEASADVTDATNVNAAGAVMNSDLATKGTLIVGDGSGDPTILGVGTNNHVLVADSNEASGVKWATVPAGSGLSNVVEDTTPQLGGDLDVNGNDIVSTSNGNINITPNGSGDVIIDGLKYPQADGSAGQYLKTNGSAQLSWSTVSTDLVGDTSPQLGGDLDVNGNIITSNSDGNVTINPDGTGALRVTTSAGGINSFGGGGDTYFGSGVTNSGVNWDYSDRHLEFKDGTKATFGTGEDLEIYHSHSGPDNQIKSTNGKIVVSTTANDDDIEITPNGTGDVVIDGLKYPQADGSAGQFLKTNGSAQLSWDTPTPPDNSVTAAKTDISIVAGDLIYGNGTDSWTRLAKSTAGKVLTMNTGATAPEWADAAAGAGGGGSDKIFWENGQTVTTNYTITNNMNAGSFGPITIDSGVTVTVGSGENWTIV